MAGWSTGRVPSQKDNGETVTVGKDNGEVTVSIKRTVTRFMMIRVDCLLFYDKSF